MADMIIIYNVIDHDMKSCLGESMLVGMDHFPHLTVLQVCLDQYFHHHHQSKIKFQNIGLPGSVLSQMSTYCFPVESCVLYLSEKNDGQNVFLEVT